MLATLSPAAFGLLAPASAQHFSPAHPPEKIKAVKVTLDFTRLNTSWARKVPGVQLSSEGAEWWYARDNSEAEYLPAVEREFGFLVAFDGRLFGEVARFDDLLGFTGVLTRHLLVLQTA